MIHSRPQKHEPAYQEYYVGPRPDDKLPPLDYSQDGCIYLNPGELYCRWRHPITQGLCTNTQRFSDTISLVEHYRLQHGCKVAPACRLWLDERDEGHQKAIQWYSNVTRGRMPSVSPPSDEPDCQNTSFDDAQTKVETTEQTPGELQARPRGVPEQRQQHKASTIQPADSNGEEKKLPDLKIEDLPLRSNEVWDRSSAISLCMLFNQHQASMPSRVRLKLLHLLKTGQFRHNDQSIRSPLKHQLSLHMYDEKAGEPKWINATYERWFILVGIYGFATLRNKASGLWQAIIMRYGERLDTKLAFKKSPDETGSLLRPFLSQLGEEVSMWTPTIQQHEYMLRQHEQIIQTQSAMIKQLREANSNQQKQIDQLKAIVGVQFRTGSPENMTGRDNSINQNVKIPNADIGSDENSPQPSEMPSKRARHS